MQTPKQYFKHYPNVNEFHFTSDGQAFFRKDDADSHAATLQEKAVKTITREEAEAMKEKADKTEIPADTVAANSTDDTGASKKDEVKQPPKKAAAAKK